MPEGSIEICENWRKYRHYYPLVRLVAGLLARFIFGLSKEQAKAFQEALDELAEQVDEQCGVA